MKMAKLTCDAAGADLNELGNITTAEAYRTGWLKDLETAFMTFRKPIIAAVRGFAVSVAPNSDKVSQS
jgi:enoyl-CoA hydratase/carnithine racemase